MTLESAARAVLEGATSSYGDHWRKWAANPHASDSAMAFSAALLALEAALKHQDDADRWATVGVDYGLLGPPLTPPRWTPSDQAPGTRPATPAPAALYRPAHGGRPQGRPAPDARYRGIRLCGQPVREYVDGSRSAGAAITAEEATGTFHYVGEHTRATVETFEQIIEPAGRPRPLGRAAAKLRKIARAFDRRTSAGN